MISIKRAIREKNMKKDNLLWGNIVKPLKNPELAGGVLVVKAKVLYLGDRIETARKKSLEARLKDLLLTKKRLHQVWGTKGPFHRTYLTPVNRQIKAVKEEIELLPRIQVWKEEYYQIGTPSNRKEALRMWNAFARSQGLV